MVSITKSGDHRLLSKVSSMYYDQGYNQQEIANRLHLSRPKISRLLKQARDSGIVQITIVSSGASFLELEIAIERKFALKEAVIIDADTSSDFILRKQLGTAAANYLHRTVTEKDIIGVTWGTTLQAMIDSLPPMFTKNVHVVQALGGVGPPEAKAHSTDISRRLSQLLNTKLTLLPAPGIVGSSDAKDILFSDRQVKTALDLFSRINTLYVGLGSIETNPVLDASSGEISESLYNEIMNSNAVGDIALRFIDIHGNPVISKLEELTIGITIEEMKKVDTVIAIAGGLEKINVIKGALSGNLIDVLITDQMTATALMNT